MKIRNYFLSHQSTKKLLFQVFVTLVSLLASSLALTRDEIGVAAAVNTTTTDNFYDPSGMFEERRLVKKAIKSFKTEPLKPTKKVRLR